MWGCVIAERDVRDPPGLYNLVAPRFPGLSVHSPLEITDHSPHLRTFVRSFYWR